MRRFLHFLFVLGLTFVGLLISVYTTLGAGAYTLLVIGAYLTRCFYKMKG